MMQKAPYVQGFDCEISVTEGEAKVSFTATPDHYHGAGGVHGAVYFFALDNSAMLAANSLETEYCMVTSNFTVQFVSPASAGTLCAHARSSPFVGRKCFVQATLYDETDKAIAWGSGQFHRSSIRLSADINYGAELAP